MNLARSEIADEQDGLNGNIDDNASLIRNTLISKEPSNLEPMQAVLRQIKETLSSSSSSSHEKEVPQKPANVLILLEPELINEYTENHKLLSAAFPYMFP